MRTGRKVMSLRGRACMNSCQQKKGGGSNPRAAASPGHGRGQCTQPLWPDKQSPASPPHPQEAANRGQESGKNFAQVMSSPQPQRMNRYRPTTPTRTSEKGDPNNPRSQQAEGPPARTLNPPPTQPNRPPRRPGNSRDKRQRDPTQGECTHVKAKTPLTRGYAVPEVGLEPTHLSIPHFECGASANSATRARSTPV